MTIDQFIGFKGLRAFLRPNGYNPPFPVLIAVSELVIPERRAEDCCFVSLG